MNITINREYAEHTDGQVAAARTPAESAARLRRLYPQYDDLVLTDADTAETYQARLEAECARRMAIEYFPEYPGDFESVTMQSEGRDNAGM